MNLLNRETLRSLAETVEPTHRVVIMKFLDEAESKMDAEVKSAMACLAKYGYKTYEDQHHEYHKLE